MDFKVIKFLLTAVLFWGTVWNFCLSGAVDSNRYSGSEFIHSRFSGEEEPGDRNIGQALPGTFVLFNSSRRNNDFLRTFRPRPNDVWVWNNRHCIVRIFPAYSAELPHITFAFQNFLQKSLPSRAGPISI